MPQQRPLLPRLLPAASSRGWHRRCHARRQRRGAAWRPPLGSLRQPGSRRQPSSFAAVSALLHAMLPPPVPPCSLYNNIIPPSRLSPGSDLHLFREGGCAGRPVAGLLPHQDAFPLCCSSCGASCPAALRGPAVRTCHRRVPPLLPRFLPRRLRALRRPLPPARPSEPPFPHMHAHTRAPMRLPVCRHRAQVGGPALRARRQVDGHGAQGEQADPGYHVAARGEPGPPPPTPHPLSLPPGPAPALRCPPCTRLPVDARLPRAWRRRLRCAPGPERSALWPPRLPRHQQTQHTTHPPTHTRARTFPRPAGAGLHRRAV